MHKLLFLLCTFWSLSANTFADKAVFAGGCFWCVEAIYQDLDGVADVISGFTGGKLKNPTYNGNHRGHLEAVEVTFDPGIISYQTLLDKFWINIDPFDSSGQFCDRGDSYRSAVFVSAGDQDRLARESLAKVQDKFPSATIYTEIRPATIFYPVRNNHQDYYKKNPLRYKLYRRGCGRDARLEQIWGEAPH